MSSATGLVVLIGAALLQVGPAMLGAMATAPRRIAQALPVILGGLAVVIALWVMPDLTPEQAVGAVGQRNDHARLVEDAGLDSNGLPVFIVELTDTGEQFEAVVQDAGSAAIPGLAGRSPYVVGDEVVVTRFVGPTGGGTAVISEPWRIPLLATVALAFSA